MCMLIGLKKTAPHGGKERRAWRRGKTAPAKMKSARTPKQLATPRPGTKPRLSSRRDDEQAEKRNQEEAKEEDVEVGQQFSEVLSPPKPPPPKKPRVGGDGGSSSQAVELTETEE